MKSPNRPAALLELSVLAPPLTLIAIFAFHAQVLRAWLAAHTLPNGYQNEIFHLNNALELWVAFQRWDGHTVHDILFQQYWPPLIYLASLPWIAVECSRDMFVLSNLLFLALLVVSVYQLGKRHASRQVGLLAAALVTLFPSIYGNLRHFEPNVALAAMVACSIWMLSLSHRFTRPGYSLLFGLLAGATLLADRLSGAFFLVFPAAYVCVESLFGGRRVTGSRRRQVWGNILVAVLGCLAVAGYYYFNFFSLHRDEVFSQVATGEILATGERSELRSPVAWSSLLFYPLTFLDAQAGFALGALLVVAIVAAIVRGDSRVLMWWSWVLGPLILFTIIQKKQIYYTIPMLPAVALLASFGMLRPGLGRLRPLLVAATLLLGLQQHQLLTWNVPLVSQRIKVGSGPHSRWIDLGLLSGRSPLPAEWVAPRYAQAWPPVREDYKIREIVDSVRRLRGEMSKFRIEVYSEDPDLYEGYLTFFIRCEFVEAMVHGLLTSPYGFYENLRLMDVFVYVTPSRRQYPTTDSIRTLMADRRMLKVYSEVPVASGLENHQDKLVLRDHFVMSSGTRAYVYGLKPWSAFAPHQAP